MGHSLLRVRMSANVAFEWFCVVLCSILMGSERFALVIPVFGSCSVETLAFPVLTVTDAGEGCVGLCWVVLGEVMRMHA